jgi:hypothetical protein
MRLEFAKRTSGLLSAPWNPGRMGTPAASMMVLASLLEPIDLMAEEEGPMKV